MMPELFRRAAALVLMPAVLCACAAAPSEEASTSPEQTAPPVESASISEPSAIAAADSPESLLARMTLREKVGQLFMVRPDALDPDLSQDEIDDDKADGVKIFSEEMCHTLEQYPVGGICQFGKNIDTPQQITELNAALQQASKIPLFLAVDEEGGRVARLANKEGFGLPQYESAAVVGSAGDPAQAQDMGRTIGNYLKQYGFNMDFAPVADVWTNPQNTVIGTRAFSRDAATAAVMARAMARGLQAEEILPTFKHFPGHGDTAEDSHSGLAYSYQTLAEMEQCEFLPFSQASDSEEKLGPRAVMVGHIAVPNLDPGDTPASLSRKIVTELLREKLLAGEDVLVVTDSLAMGAITGQYDPGQAAVQAFLAGNDILLMPAGLQEAFDAVVTAVENGTISQTRLEESVARILRFKQQYAGLQPAAVR